jgi:group I intron endonuclease
MSILKFLVMTIPSASTYLSTILITDLLFILSLISCYITEINGGLFQISLLTQISIIGDFSFIPSIGGFEGEKSYLILSFIPIVYSNAETDKSQILSDNKGLAGVYMFTHKETGKLYIGSSVDLSLRIKNYYSFSHLKQVDNYIARALLLHGYEAFSISILEHIDISNLSKEEARLLILKREQYFLDNMLFSEPKPETYNILQTAGSLLGFSHPPESRAKMSEGRKGPLNHQYGKKGVLNLKSGKPLDAEHRGKISEGKIGALNLNFGKEFSAGHCARISAAKGGGTIFVYDTNKTLVNSFISARKAAKFFNCSHATISNYIKSGKLFQDKWTLSLKIKE